MLNIVSCEIFISLQKTYPNYEPLEFDDRNMSKIERMHKEFELLVQRTRVEDFNDPGFKVGITNVLNAQYLGEIFVGNYKMPKLKNEKEDRYMNKPGVVVFDTGSNWLAMTSTLCDECETKVFDVDNSVTAKRFDEEEFDQSYGSASLSGYVYHDTVCLHSI